MKRPALQVLILLATAAAAVGALWATAAESVAVGNRLLLAALAAGLVVGNLWLLRYALRARGVGWTLLKGLLFNAGWALALGLLLTAPAPATPVPAAAAPAALDSHAGEREDLRRRVEAARAKADEAQQRLNASEQAAAEQRRKQLEPYNTLSVTVENVKGELERAEKANPELKNYTTPLVQQAESTRKSVEAEKERLQRQFAAAGAAQSAGLKEYERLRDELERLRNQLASIPPPPSASTSAPEAAPVPALPTAWRYLLCVLGFLSAAAGLVVADETLLRPLMRLFPFLKGEERKRREKAESLFRQAKQLLREEKVSEALPLCEALETDLLPAAERPEARFYHAYATFHVEGAEAALPLLKKQHAQSQDYVPSSYLLAYAHLSAEQYEQASAVWEQVYTLDPDYLETRHHYSSALLARARQLIAEANVNEALPLFKIVRELGVHADAVPEGLQNAHLMEAVGKLREGDTTGAAAVFAQVEKEGAADKSPEGARLAALGKLGLALVKLSEGRGDEAEPLLTECAETFHKLTGVEAPAECAPELLLKPISDAGGAAKLAKLAEGSGEKKEGEPEAAPEEKAALAGTPQDHTLLRDTYFLQGMARVLKWSREIALDRSSGRDTAARDSALISLRHALYFDKTFADALAVYGFLLFFHSKSRSVAATFLKQARTFGFEEEALSSVLQYAERVSQARVRSRTQILDRLHEYFTNEEVPREFKEELLREEAIRRGYQEYVGEIKLEEIKEHQPTLADLVARSSYLHEEVDRIVRELEAGGTEPVKLATINAAMENLKNRNEEIAKVKGEIEKEEERVLRESGVFVLSQEF